MIRHPPSFTLTATLFPYTTLCLSRRVLCLAPRAGGEACGACKSCALFASRAQYDPLETRPDGSLSHPWGHSAHPDFLLVGYEWKRSEEHTSELQSLMRISYSVFCLKQKKSATQVRLL